MRITAEFVISAAGARDLPQDGLPELALVGRSNVGKSSLINALTRQRVARTSAAPGKTRLANIYRVARGVGRGIYLVDLPGYGYARGGSASAREFEELTRAYFGRDAQEGRDGQVGRDGQGREDRQDRQEGRDGKNPPAPPALPAQRAALLLVDSRHPGLPADIDAWVWLRAAVRDASIVATKVDKLASGERIRSMRELESVFDVPALPVSAVTGEGLDQLWKLIDRLANSHNPNRRSNSSLRHQKATAPRRPASEARPPRKR